MSIGLVFAILCALLGLGYGVLSIRWVLAQPQGNAQMRQVADAIREGASAYLNRQYLAIALVGLPLMAALSYSLGLETGIGFLIGALLSGAAGFIGMHVSVRANLRTAEAARAGTDTALQLAFRGGAVTGLLVVGLALLGVAGYTLWLLLQAPADGATRLQTLHALLGFAFGGSLISIFARLGGGIFTKGADIGADNVGVLGAKLPEDDPRNPAAIADNVGDNVGDCAGTAADLFETFAVTLIAAVLLGGFLLGAHGDAAMLYPLVIGGISVVASVIGTSFVQADDGEDRRIMDALYKGVVAAAVIAFLLFVPATWLLLPSTLTLDGGGASYSRWGVLGAAGVGLGLTGMMFIITEYYTGTDYPPVRSIAKASVAGEATNIIAGFGISMKATAAPVLILCVAIWGAYSLAGLYGIAIAATAMVGMAGMVLALDALGPIADNAGGILRMAQMDEQSRAVTDRLDAVGNVTKAVTKGYAIASAGLAALVLFADYTLALGAAGKVLSFQLDNPAVLIGLLVGALMPYLFAALAVEAVGRAGAEIVAEVQRQFTEHPGILDASERPDYTQAARLLTRSAIQQMLVPSLLPVLVPVVVAYGMRWLMGGDAGVLALGGMLIGSLITGLFVALSMTAGGGAWDNAKKHIEAGHFGGPGSPAHKAAIIGDSIGDPYKDAAGPAINPLIKIVNLVALLLVPLILV